MLAELLSGVALVCNGQLAPPPSTEPPRRADPPTRAERRYLRRRMRLQQETVVPRYMEARPAISGGVSIEDGPRHAFWLARVTQDVAEHRAALRRLSRFPVRVRKVAHSERSLRRLQNSLDFDAARADGFRFSSTYVDIDANAVVVELITERTDHAAYFRERYGPLVRTVVIATRSTRLDCARAAAWEPARGGLRLHWVTGGGARLARVEVSEHRDRVEVGIVERVPNGPRTLEARPARTRVKLAAPLGGRRVIDAATGLRLRRGSSAFGR